LPTTTFGTLQDAVPADRVVGEHCGALPGLTDHVREPVGVGPPSGGFTVAVNVMVPPYAGLLGEDTMVMVGWTGTTVTDAEIPLEAL